jgi:stage V sporulation protein B
LEQPKEQNYLHGAVILTLGVIITKILGAIYKIPLGNILGDDGYAYFYSAYSVYYVFLIMATAGLPVAVSRMVAEANEQGRVMQSRRIFSVSWWTFLVLGIITASIMFLFPEELAGLLNRPEAAKSIYAIAPGILFVCMVSTYRGYCQGCRNMTPTTIGQIIEVLIKVIVGLGLAILFVRQGKDTETACAGAAFGVTVGGFGVLIYMAAYKRRHYRYEPLSDPDTPESRGRILGTLLRIGIPITIGATAMSIISLIDTKFINNRLQLAAGFSQHESSVLFGVFCKAQTLYNLPAAFVTPLVISIVPTIAACMVDKKQREAGAIAEDALRITLDVCMPMGIGLAVLAYPIMNILYPNSYGAGPILLAMMGVASFFVCFSLVQNAVLQAHGNETLTIYSILTGGIIKVAVDWFLVGNPDINIYGAPFGTLLCYVVMCVMNQAFINRHYEYKPKLSRVIPKPLVSSLIMGVITYGAYKLLAAVVGESSYGRMALCMLVSIVIGVAVYLVAAVQTRAITYDDMALIPKGEKIAKLLHIRPAPKHLK